MLYDLTWDFVCHLLERILFSVLLRHNRFDLNLKRKTVNTTKTAVYKLLALGVTSLILEKLSFSNEIMTNAVLKKSNPHKK